MNKNQYTASFGTNTDQYQQTRVIRRAPVSNNQYYTQNTQRQANRYYTQNTQRQANRYYTQNTQRQYYTQNTQYPNSQMPPQKGGVKKAPQSTAPKAPPKRKYTREQLRQIKEQRRILQQQRFDIFKRRAIAFLKTFAIRSAAVIVLAAVFFGIYASLFMLSLNLTGSGRREEYGYRVGIEFDPMYTLEDEGGYRIDGVWYVSMTDVVNYCDMITTGDDEHLRFILKNSGNENVSFTANSSVVMINGVKVKMADPVIVRNGDFLVPAEFFENYVNGMTVLIDDKNKLFSIQKEQTEESRQSTSLYKALKEDKDKKNDIARDSVLVEYTDMSFTLKKAVSSEMIPEYTLGSELLAATDPQMLAALEAAKQQAALDAAAAANQQQDPQQ